MLLTVTREINVPRLPSLKGKMAAKKAVIGKMDFAAIGAEEGKVGLKGSPTQVQNIFAPPVKGNRRMLEGPIEEQIKTLVDELRRLQCV